MVVGEIATTVVIGIAALAVLLGVVWFLLPFMASRPCTDCGQPMDPRAATCLTCGAEAPKPPDAHPGGAPYGFPEPAGGGHGRRVEVEDGMAFNRGLNNGVITVATGAMLFGIGLRLVGMLGILGLPQVPVFIEGMLTIVGGLVAFVGFVFLDAA